MSIRRFLITWWLVLSNREGLLRASQLRNIIVHRAHSARPAEANCRWRLYF
jgi:hypothetical protein